MVDYKDALAEERSHGLPERPAFLVILEVGLLHVLDPFWSIDGDLGDAWGTESVERLRTMFLERGYGVAHVKRRASPYSSNSLPMTSRNRGKDLTTKTTLPSLAVRPYQRPVLA